MSTDNLRDTDPIGGLTPTFRTLPSPSMSSTQASPTQVSTPFGHEGLADPENAEEPNVIAPPRKRKKKPPKKSAKAKGAASAGDNTAEKQVDQEARSPLVLCISRNKHWRYISSYHGPWLQLPIELLDSLLLLNLDPASLASPERFSMSLISPAARYRYNNPYYHATNMNNNTTNNVGYIDNIRNAITPPDSPHPGSNDQHGLTLPPPTLTPLPQAGKPNPPPIDPGVFRSVAAIRRFIDEAAELSVRASSAAEMGSMRGGPSGPGNGFGGGTGGLYGSAAYPGSGGMYGGGARGGGGPYGNHGYYPGFGGNAGGRAPPLSANRINLLRKQAVQKLAQAYKTDEIASSVMVMQGGSVFDDVAERVLRHDPNDVDAKYVHFFHEKIPSRQLAESTTTNVLDELIVAQPQRLEFYRTRGIVHCFRDEYQQATKDFTFALKEAKFRRQRLGRHALGGAHGHGRGHSYTGGTSGAAFEAETKSTKSGKRKKGSAPGAQMSSHGTEFDISSNHTPATPEDEPLGLHPSVLPDAPDPIEHQLLFLRGAAYLQYAIYLIEGAVLELEGVKKTPNGFTPIDPLNHRPAPPSPPPSPSSNHQAQPTNIFLDPTELRIANLAIGRLGGVEVGNSDGPLGRREGRKLRAYRNVLAKKELREKIGTLLRKSIRDHERFLSHFESVPVHIPVGSRVGVHESDVSTVQEDSLGEGGGINGGTDMNGIDSSAYGGTADLSVRIEYAFVLTESLRPGGGFTFGTGFGAAAAAAGLGASIGGNTTTYNAASFSSADGFPAPPLPGQSSSSAFADSSLNSNINSPTNQERDGVEDSEDASQKATYLPPMLTTYHPLLVESHFSILICQMMMGDFAGLLQTFARTAALVDGLEGYPVFLPPRSMGQAEFVEVLERLAGGWKNGIQPHSLVQQNKPIKDKNRLIQGPPVPSIPSPISVNSGGTTGGSTKSKLKSKLKSKASSTNFNGFYENGGDGAADGEVPLFFRPDAHETLDYLRILLAPVVKRQKEKAEQMAVERAAEIVLEQQEREREREREREKEKKREFLKEVLKDELEAREREKSEKSEKARQLLLQQQYQPATTQSSALEKLGLNGNLFSDVPSTPRVSRLTSRNNKGGTTLKLTMSAQSSAPSENNVQKPPLTPIFKNIKGDDDSISGASIPLQSAGVASISSQQSSSVPSPITPTTGSANAMGANINVASSSSTALTVPLTSPPIRRTLSNVSVTTTASASGFGGYTSATSAGGAPGTGTGNGNGNGNGNGSGARRKPAAINIPLHGPRVEVILAWLAAVHLPELDVQ